MNMLYALSIQDYHEYPAIGKSTLDLIARDPHLVEWSRNVPVDNDKLGAINVGDAMHAIILEPHRLKSDFAVMPELNLRTNDGKAKAEEFRAANQNKRIISADEFKRLQMMYDSVLCHPQARKILEAQDAINEASFFWADERTGLQCKCRPDRLMASDWAIDVKTTPTMRDFSYAVEDYRYHVQAAYYADGLAANSIDREMAFLVVGKNIELGRYPVQVVTLPDEAVLYGRQLYRRDLDNYAAFLQRRKDSDALIINELPMHARFLDLCVSSLEIEL